MTIFALDDKQVYRAEAFDRLPWLEHGFGTRLAGDWLADRPHATLKQIHSARVYTVDGTRGCLGEGDALVSNHPGALLVIRTADCVPVLLADRERRTVGAVHAGWRGAVEGVAGETVRAMADGFGSRPEDIEVAIGPAIGACCYEVGAEVASRFERWFPERNDLAARTRIDLAECLARQIRELGVAETAIHRAARCTACRPAEFHSWRRDRAAARMFTAIGIRGIE